MKRVVWLLFLLLVRSLQSLKLAFHLLDKTLAVFSALSGWLHAGLLVGLLRRLGGFDLPDVTLLLLFGVDLFIGELREVVIKLLDDLVKRLLELKRVLLELPRYFLMLLRVGCVCVLLKLAFN